MADTLVDDYDVIDLLDRLVGYSVELLAADAAGILLADARGDLRVVASTNEQTEWMELMQLQADEGPCVECFRTGAPVSVADLADAAARWPRFVAALDGARRLPLGACAAAAAARRGHRHAEPVPPAAGPAARRRPGAGPGTGRRGDDRDPAERAIRRGEVLNEQLQIALNSRVIIEQAKGVLAQRGNLSMDAAFDRLRRYARQQQPAAQRRWPARSSTPTSPPTCSPHPRPPGHPR